jgi:hypothetical protein
VAWNSDIEPRVIGDVEALGKTPRHAHELLDKSRRNGSPGDIGLFDGTEIAINDGAFMTLGSASV